MKQTKTIFLISKIREKANKFILADLAQHGITKLAPSHGDILACLYQRDFRLYPSDETNGNGARK